MAKINPYLIFDGNAEDAFNFYKSVFGGDFRMPVRFKDMPESEDFSPSEKDKIMHIALAIGKDSVLMGSDSPHSQKLKIGNNFYISIDAESKEEAEKLFDSLSAGGQVEMPLADAPWKAYFGMLTDKFGINWMVSYQYAK